MFKKKTEMKKYRGVCSKGFTDTGAWSKYLHPLGYWLAGVLRCFGEWGVREGIRRALGDLDSSLHSGPNLLYVLGQAT